MADLLLALIGTGLGALAGILGNYLLPRLPLQFQLAPVALSVEVTIVAVLASVLSIMPLADSVFSSRASQRRMKLKKLLQKDKAFFIGVHDDISILVGERGRQHAD